MDNPDFFAISANSIHFYFSQRFPMCGKGFGHWLESYTGDLDTAFAYRTARTLTIRDKRLGLGLLALQGIIFLYIIVYQITLTQVYFAVGDFNSVVRLQLQAPTANYRWPGGAPPYCRGSLTLPPASDYPLAAGYSLPGDGTFTKDGVSYPQRLCNFFDETTAVPIVETDRMFVTTETRSTLQSTSPECSDLGQLSCVFLPPYNRNNGNVTQRAFVADIELFTLLIDHNMNSPLAGLHYASTDMEGKLLSATGARVNPCDDYAGLPGGCPTMAANGFDVALGSPGKPDIVPLRTLLRAAGISSLDTLAGLKGADAGESHREAGLVLNVDISYTNYYLDASSTRLGTGSMNTSVVKYTYQVSTVRNTEYKLITGVSPFGNATVRQNLNRHGLRIIVTTSGWVGYFNVSVRGGVALPALVFAFSQPHPCLPHLAPPLNPTAHSSPCSS
jgi:hypothetical protein